jgi:RNA methyltransferase, TrmH family
MIHLTSVQNERVKEVLHLRDRKQRDLSDRFLIEGYRELWRAQEAQWTVEELFICRELFLGVNEEKLIEKFVSQGTRLFNCSEKVFHKLSYRDRPDGLLGVALQRHLTLQDFDAQLSVKANPFLAIAEAIEKPGNLGTILRSSDAVGLDGLIVCERGTDIFNPNVVRASVGTLFSVPVVQAKNAETYDWLKKRGIQILAATPSAERTFTEVDLRGPLAIAVGTEQLGLSDFWMKKADLQVRIPMKGAADSLNVAMATTLLLYEVLRQRNEISKQ